MELDGVKCKANGIAIVMGGFNATIATIVKGVVGPHILGRKTSKKWEKLVSFASAHGMCVTNIQSSPHKHIHQHSWYPPNPSKLERLHTDETKTQTISIGHPGV